MNSEVLIKFKGDTSSADSATKKMSTSIGNLTKAFTLGNLAAKGLTKAIQVFNSGLDGAISRADTLNNFPKVMSNLGIGVDEANESITTLSDKLKGLPTSLDSAAMSVQRLTSKNGNVEESTKMFLALNNAILAGGASSQLQASAIEQISQAYAKGKPDMMEWRSMMAAMPAQLKQVATAMGYVNADELGAALRDGSASMDDFMNTITKLNETGVAGFENFETQARNATGGIGTSVTNMKTAVVRGITNMLKSLDKSFEKFGGLSGVISKIGEFGEKVFSGIGEGIGTILPPLIEIVEGVMPSLTALFEQISPYLQQFVSMILPVITDLINQLLPILIQVAQMVLPVIMQMISQIAPVLSQIITTILPIFQQLLNTILPPLMQIISKILPVLIKLVESILPLLQPILDLLTPLIEAIFEIINPLVDILSEILPPIIDLLSTILQAILPPLTAVIKVLMEIIVNSIQWMIGIVKPIIDNLKDRIQSITGVLKGIIDFVKNVFTGNWEGAWEAVKNIFKNIAEGIGNIFKMPINFIINAMNLFIRGLNKIKIPDWVPAVGGKGINIPEIPTLNVGTNFVPEDTLAMIHQGEAVIPKKFNPYANGMNASTLGAMMSSGTTPIINVYADFEMDPIGQVVSSIKTFSGGAKNDYNYGQGV